MKISKQIKQQILNEYNRWVDKQYAGKSQEERSELGQYFTPAELTIQMIEKFDNLDGTILDPCAGCGGLLAACIIAGADPNNIYGIELDPEILKLCQERLCAMGVPKWHIHLGDALVPECYEFSEDYIYPFPEVKEVNLWY